MLSVLCSTQKKAPQPAHSSSKPSPLLPQTLHVGSSGMPLLLLLALLLWRLVLLATLLELQSALLGCQWHQSGMESGRKIQRRGLTLSEELERVAGMRDTARTRMRAIELARAPPPPLPSLFQFPVSFVFKLPLCHWHSESLAVSSA